jgi:hypothetical protein
MWTNSRRHLNVGTILYTPDPRHQIALPGICDVQPQIRIKTLLGKSDYDEWPFENMSQ